MRGTSILKAKKLMKITLDYEDGKIVKVKINGDFFLHPEESVTKLEDGLVGCELETEKIEDKVEEILEKEKIEVFGFNSYELAKAILMAGGLL